MKHAILSPLSSLLSPLSPPRGGRGGLLLLLATLLLLGCQQPAPTECHISGTVIGSQYEGVRIFLVPFYGPKTAEYVDSVEIRNGRFEFTPDSVQLYKIVLDYHYRMDIQQLLVIGEPGEVSVVIDTVSHATGTPQNDSLEHWKQLTEQQNLIRGQLRQQAAALQAQRDTAGAQVLKAQADSIYMNYKRNTRAMAASMEGTVVGDFLKEMFPLTYRHQMPDGTVVTYDADTRQPISE